MDAGIEKAVGQNLRRIREAAGLTQETVAVRLQLRKTFSKSATMRISPLTEPIC